jgi:hypothetical protein
MTPPQGAGFSEEPELFVILMSRLFPLLLDVFSNHFGCHLMPNCPDIVPIAPKLPSPKLLLDLRKLPKYLPCRYTSYYLHYFCGCVSRWRSHEHMNVISVGCHRINHPSVSLADSRYQLTQSLRNSRPVQQVFAILYNPHHVIPDIPTSMRSTQCIAHPTTLPYLPPHLKGSPPQEAGFK